MEPGIPTDLVEAQDVLVTNPDIGAVRKQVPVLVNMGKQTGRKDGKGKDTFVEPQQELVLDQNARDAVMPRAPVYRISE